jgi:hypothetical protein
MIVLLLAALAPQETLEPARHPWMAWKPGAAARYNVVLELGAARQEGGVAYTLAEVGLRGCSLKVVATQLDKRITSDQTEDLPVREKTEAVAVGDQSFSCGVWKARGLRGGLVSETRLWLRPEGGAPLRMTSKIDGQEDLALAAVALEDVVKAAGRELRCARLEGRDVLKNHVVRAWFSPDIPGGLVKMVTTAKVNGQALTSTLELVDVVEKR